MPNDVLRGRADSYVKRRKEEYPKYSLNDLFVDALRAYLDGPAAPAVQVWPQPSHDLRVSGFGQPDRIISADEQARAIEHARAAEAPFGKSVTELLASKAQQPSAATIKTPARPWLPELLMVQAKYEESPGEGIEEYATLIKRLKVPNEYRTFQPGDSKMLSKRAAILDARAPLPAADSDGW